MKRIAIIFVVALVAIVCCLPLGSFAYAETTSQIKEGARSAYLVDYDSGKVLYERNADAELPIASMVKIMTLLLTFEQVDAGNLEYETPITISQNAASMGGSQMFLCAGSTYPLKDLIKGITVCSANDASVAVGETIGGSTQGFIDMMNKRAKELGMNNTVFVNITGLPADGQHSTAKDVSIMMRSLLSHDDYYNFSKITLEDYTHPDGRVTQMVNTNKLLRYYNGCDAGKTGFTNAAMFCLSASAKRNNLRVIATVVGATDSKSRFAEVGSLFDYAYAKYENRKIINSENIFEGSVQVKRGVNGFVGVKPSADVNILCKKGENTEFDIKIEGNADICAPIFAGDVVGRAVVYNTAGEVVGSTPLIATCDIPELDYKESLFRVLRNWYASK